MDFLMHIFSSWMGWLGIGGLGLGAGLTAAWFFGLMPLIGAAAQVAAAVLAPVLRAMVDGAIWLWQHVFWPGLWDILDDWVTIVTVATMGAILYFVIMAHAELKVLHVERDLNSCKVELQKVEKTRPEGSTPTWFNPFSW